MKNFEKLLTFPGKTFPHFFERNFKEILLWTLKETSKTFSKKILRPPPLSSSKKYEVIWKIH